MVVEVVVVVVVVVVVGVVVVVVVVVVEVVVEVVEVVVLVEVVDVDVVVVVVVVVVEVVVVVVVDVEDGWVVELCEQAPQSTSAPSSTAIVSAMVAPTSTRKRAPAPITSSGNAGAMTGTTMNTMNAIDITRAIGRP